MKETSISLRRVVLTALLTALVVFSFTGCQLIFGEDPIAVKGSWASSFGESWVITDDTITYDGGFGSYTAEIISYENDGLNAGDTSVVKDGAVLDGQGYAVIKYTEVTDASYGTVGKYNIFRWGTAAGDASMRSLTQGGKYVGTWGQPDYALVVFDTAAEASSGATNDDGYFGFASDASPADED